MTVPSETNRSGPYNGNGVTTVFGYGFRIVDEDHLRVIRTSALGVETVLTIDADYIVSDVGEAAGGQIAATVAPATGETITILRAVPFVQETDLENQGAYYAETVEDALDLAAMRDQQLSEELGRAIRVPASTDPDADLQLPAPESGKVIAWNAGADGLQNLSPTELISVAAYGTALADIFTGNGVQVAFALSASPVAINNLDVAQGGVTQLPGVDYTWSSGTTITFTTAPPVGVKILVRYMQALAFGRTDADVVSYDDGGDYTEGSVGSALQYRLPIADPVSIGISRNKDGSWPTPQNAIVTTATYNATDTITVPDGSQINNGDTITASFLPYQTYVVSGGGTNTIVMSRVAVGSGAAPVTFGNDRWDMTSATVGDTAGYRRVYIGQAAKGRSTLQNKINGAGLDYQQVTAFACENEFGGVGGWFGARMSLEDTGLAGIIALGTYCLIDEDPVSRHAWNRYEQSNLKSGTAPTGSGQFIHVEASLESYWPAVDIDPYNYNPAGSTRIYRWDSGIGDYAGRGEAPPNNISAIGDIVENGAKARAGFVFGAGSLDETGARRPAVIAMPPNYCLAWYRAAASPSWRVMSTATTGSGYILHTDGLVTFGETEISVNRAAGVGKNIYLRTAGSDRWGVGATATAESGGNAGSDFAIGRFSDAAAFLGLSFSIRRSTGRPSMGDLAGLTKYADNAAALAGGLVAGDLYATTAGDLRIVV